MQTDLHTYFCPFMGTWFSIFICIYFDSPMYSIITCLPLLCLMFSSIFQNPSFNFKMHLHHGAYWCTHSLDHMPTFVLHLHVHFSNTCVCVFKHLYAFTNSSIFIHIYRHIYMYVRFNYSVLATHNLYIPIVIRLYVSVTSHFSWCIRTCVTMFKGLYFIMKTYLFLLSIHVCHVHTNLLNFCMHLPFPSVRSSTPSSSIPTPST